MEEQERDLRMSQAEGHDHNKNEDPYAIEEIEIEEMAIDGICGVY
jgi:mycofactocin precursor